VEVRRTDLADSASREDHRQMRNGGQFKAIAAEAASRQRRDRAENRKFADASNTKLMGERRDLGKMSTYPKVKTN